MKITEIPEILFKEFSEDTGQGEKRKILYQGSTEYDIIELNPGVAGFNGVIGFRKTTSCFGDACKLVLWSRIPKGEASIFEPDPTLLICSGPEYAGHWVYGKGMFLEERCTAKLGVFDGINLLDPASRFAVLMLQRCLELIAEAKVSEPFYQVEKNPNLLYNKP